MKPLPAALDEYLALRHSLGYKFCEEGGLLRQFVIFAGETGAVFITTDLALTWATRQPAKNSPQWCRRVRVVRHFAQYCSAHDPRTEVPPPGLLPHRYQRPTPYIYRDEEIGRLLAAAAELPSKTGLRPRTFVTLFALYAVTGMRCREPLQLDRTDVDWQNGVLTIRGTKFGKSRLLPLHPRTVDALRAYAVCRDRLCRDPDSPSFFLSEAGTRLSHWTVRATFVTRSRWIGLRGPNDSHGPQLHDLRHRMAVNTLLRWYREDVDVERHLPTLATYLGHAHVTDTYWSELGISGIPSRLGCPFIFWHPPGDRYLNVASRFVAIVKRARARAKAEKRPLPRGFRFHDLRHWYAVDYLRRGGSIYTLQQILGHSSIKTTELYLPYLMPGEQEQAKSGTAQNPAQ